MLRVRRPSDSEIDRLLTEAREASPTYPEVGATRDAQLPSGYSHDFYERRLGQGAAVFARAGAALRGWPVAIGAGVRALPHGAEVGDGGTVMLLIRVGGLWAPLPCRVVYADEGPEGYAFAYGTLPGHPEKGEVAFRVERSNTSDEVFFRVVSFS